MNVQGGSMLKNLLNVFKKKCPKCKSTKIENMGETVEGDNIKLGSKCHDCGHEWYKKVEIGSADDLV